MSQATVTRPRRTHRRPRLRVSWGAAATSAFLRSEWRHAPPAEDVGPDLTALLERFRDRLAAALRPLADEIEEAVSRAPSWSSGDSSTDTGGDGDAGAEASDRVGVRLVGRLRAAWLELSAPLHDDSPEARPDASAAPRWRLTGGPGSEPGAEGAIGTATPPGRSGRAHEVAPRT
ncbi:MAG TPA: hypothetical protein VEY67_02800 [Candidatus Dormibacteraeota bacterium]|nr:hypothetical protein [Candidatus Dormibacteraeota bacterium]